MSKFRDLAVRATTLSDLMDGRDKIDTEDLISEYPNGFTVDDLDLCTVGDEPLWVYTIRENDDAFAFAGSVLKKIFDAFLASCEGDLDTLRNEFDGLKIKLKSGKTKKGKDITLVEVL